jgi:predicted phage terminase large subunit-like protein
MEVGQRLKYLKIVRELKINRARLYFWEYCKLKRPKFFTEDKTYLRKICETLQALYEKRIIRYISDAIVSDKWEIISKDEKERLDAAGVKYEYCTKIMINTPPRFGKSSTLVLFDQWCLGKNSYLKIISVSYNERLSGRFGRDVRNGIDETKEDPYLIVYNDIFPDVRIKQGDASYLIWSLEGRFFTYLATSFQATVTGIGCDILLIDDPIRSHEEAFNIDYLNKQYEYYTDTLLQRCEEGAIQIIDMTRWSKFDLCGMLIEDKDWYVINYEAIDEETDTMLCDTVLSKTTYEYRKKKMNPVIFRAIYHGRPVDLEGTVYTFFKTYIIRHIYEEDSETGKQAEFITLNDYRNNIELFRIKNDTGNKTKFDLFDNIYAYCDTADEGDDYLCLIIVGIYKGQAYILAVLYSDKPMEYTEKEAARLLYENKVRYCKVESNKGGKGFARMVEGILWNDYKSRLCNIEWFHQTGNKMARILTNSTYVMQNVLFPANWSKKWADFYDSLTTFQKEGENQHDDAEDAITGIAEMLRGNQPVTEDDKEMLEEYLQEQFERNL